MLALTRFVNESAVEARTGAAVDGRAVAGGVAARGAGEIVGRLVGRDG